MLGFSTYSYWRGVIVGRSGSPSVVQAQEPVLFWVFLSAFAFGGALSFAYGLAKIVNRAQWFTRYVDVLLDKLWIRGRSDKTGG